MKTTTILLSVFLLTTSCLSRKTTQKVTDLSSASQRDEVFNRSQWLYQLQEHDSNHVTWHFRTDAPFSYDPDTGLHAQRGDLMFSMQSAHWRRLINESNDTATHITDRQQWHEDRTTISERRPDRRKTGWWIAGILLVIGGYYLVWNSKTK